MARTTGYIDVTIRYRREAGQWTAECLELGTAACADSFEDVQEAIDELMRLQLDTLKDLGTRAAFFKKHGIAIIKTKRRVVKERELVCREGQVMARRITPLLAVAGAM